MLRLQKKKEEDAKAAAAAAAAASEEIPEKQSGDGVSGGSSGATVSLLGIGGKAVTTGSEKKNISRRTPGELRVQKGKKYIFWILERSFNH